MIIYGIVKIFIMFLTLSLYTLIGLVIFLVTQLILYKVFKFNLYKKIDKFLWGGVKNSNFKCNNNR